ncbi:MAG: hypothetical protein ACI9G9_001373, partial [Psychromonas sp.]
RTIHIHPKTINPQSGIFLKFLINKYWRIIRASKARNKVKDPQSIGNKYPEKGIEIK